MIYLYTNPTLVLSHKLQASHYRLKHAEYHIVAIQRVTHNCVVPSIL